MKKPPEVDSIYKTARTEVKLILDFAEEVDASLAIKMRPKPERPFTQSEAEELRELGEAFIKATSPEPKKEKVVFRKKISENVGHFMMSIVKPIKQRGFMADMALVYLACQLEAFAKDYILAILIKNPEMLRSSASIQLDELANYKSIKLLWVSVAEKEVETLGHGSIDDLSVYLQKKLNIDASVYPKWHELREHIYRRNIVTHNRGRINETYLKKIRSTDRPTPLTTDMNYIKSAATNILEFMEFMHTEVSRKYSKVKKSKAT